MSMNIHIKAVRHVQVLSTRKIVEQSIAFNAWQTPTSVTEDILASLNPSETYKNWIRQESVNMDILGNIFDDEDILEEGEPIGTRIYNPGLDHLEMFDTWLKMCADEGFTVKFEMV